MTSRVAALAVIAAAATAATAVADWTELDGQPLVFNGFAGPEFGGTNWGTWEGQGLHTLGGFSQYERSFHPGLYITVTSWVNDPVPGEPYSASFVVDFSASLPGNWSFQGFEIYGLKNDNSIIGVSGNLGGFWHDGNAVFWTGSGADLASVGNVLSFKVYQQPTPGALAILGMAGAMGSRRRRS